MLDELTLRSALQDLGLESQANGLVAAALEEARGGPLAEGLHALLMTRPSQFESKLDEFEAQDRVALARSRRILEQKEARASHSPVAIEASQVSSVTVTKVQATTTVRSGRQNGTFAYFGVEVTDGVRVGASKQDYPGVKIVKSKGAALQAGIKAGDFIKEIAGKRVQSLEVFRQVVGTLPTKPFPVVINREGEEMTLMLKPQATNAPPGSLSRYTQNIPVTTLVPDDLRPRSASENSMGRRPARLRG